MFAFNTATWIIIVLLAPFWWGLGLLLLAWLGDVVTAWRGPVLRLLERLDRTHRAPIDRIDAVPPGHPA
jgi:hypothetical protein